MIYSCASCMLPPGDTLCIHYISVYELAWMDDRKFQPTAARWRHQLGYTAMEVAIYYKLFGCLSMSVELNLFITAPTTAKHRMLVFCAVAVLDKFYWVVSLSESEDVTHTHIQQHSLQPV